jgi:hypothetical protein
MPQESFTLRLHWLPQLLAGVQQVPLEPHSSPTGQGPLHWTCILQLLVKVMPPQRPAQGLFGTQHAGQPTVSPQLLVTVIPQWPAQAIVSFGMQHVPFARHVWPEAQSMVPLTPQLTGSLQLSVAWPHWRLPQACAVVWGTQPQTPWVHVRPPSQLPQS